METKSTDNFFCHVLHSLPPLDLKSDTSIVILISMCLKLKTISKERRFQSVCEKILIPFHFNSKLFLMYINFLYFSFVSYERQTNTSSLGLASSIRMVIVFTIWPCWLVIVFDRHTKTFNINTSNLGNGRLLFSLIILICKLVHNFQKLWLAFNKSKGLKGACA